MPLSKKINRWVFSSLVAIALTLSIEGCSTTGSQSPTVIAYKTVASTTTTVDTARQAWNQWVITGHATVDQVTKVANDYALYQQSMATAQVAINSYNANPDPNQLNKVMAAVSDSSANLLGLINTIMAPTATK